jgi:hypothetical protein
VNELNETVYKKRSLGGIEAICNKLGLNFAGSKPTLPRRLFFAAQQRIAVTCRSLISIKRSAVQRGERISKKNDEMSYNFGEIIKKQYSLFQEAKPSRHSRLPPHLLASCDGGFSTWWREMYQLQAPFSLARFTR